MDEEEKKVKVDDGIASYFTRYGGFCLFVVVVDLWEAQPCLWDPE